MKYTLLIIIFCLAAFLRLYSLSNLPDGLHWDEMDTGYQAYSLLKTGKDYFGNPLPLFPHSLADYRTPVYLYSAVPIIAKFGLTAFSVRFVSVIWALLSIILIYLLSVKIFGRSPITLLSPLIFGLSPWHLQYSRKSVETISLTTCVLLGLVCFYRGLKQPKWLILSGIAFGLSVAAYSPGKLFTPLFVLILILVNFSVLKHINRKYLVLSAFCFMVIITPVIGDSVWGKSGSRFHNLSIFTDPTIATEVNFKRQDFTFSRGVPRQVGIVPGPLEKIVHNKPEEWINAFSSNYLRTFSTEFLFIKGDSELRHSPSKDRIGQLHIIEILPLLIGLFVLRRKHAFLILWLLLAPLPSALTRDGGTHAARLLILFPALSLIITAGVIYLFQKTKILFILYLTLFFISSFYIFSYYFSHYRWESAKPFQWGFSQIVRYAITKSPDYDRIIVDMHEDSALMAYLYTVPFPPDKFQSLQPLQQTHLIPEMPSLQFNNIFLLQPNSLHWSSLMDRQVLSGKNLIIAKANDSAKNLKLIKTIDYPDSSPAFYVFEIIK